MRVAKLAMLLITPFTNCQPSSDPEMVAGWRTMGPAPPALTRAQMKKEMPQMGTKYDLTVNKCRILCTGNQMAGSEHSQKMKNAA